MRGAGLSYTYLYPLPPHHEHTAFCVLPDYGGGISLDAVNVGLIRPSSLTPQAPIRGRGGQYGLR